MHRGRFSNVIPVSGVWLNITRALFQNRYTAKKAVRLRLKSNGVQCGKVCTRTKIGAIAQLVAHLHGMQGVRGSNPLSSTYE